MMAVMASSPRGVGVRPDSGLRASVGIVAAGVLLFALGGCAYDSVSVFVGVDPGAVGFPLPGSGWKSSYGTT